MKPSILFVSAPFSGIEVMFRNLQAQCEGRTDVDTEWIFVEWSPPEGFTRLPLVRHDWTLKAGLVTRRRIAALDRAGRKFDVVVFNSVVPAYLQGSLRRRIPSVYCLDATPATLREDAIWHAGRSRLVSAAQDLKWNLMTRPLYHRAAGLVCWTRRVRDSLVQHYHVPAEAVTMIQPGLDLQLWPFIDRSERARDHSRPLEILFVGGDFRRKGGEVLRTIAQMPEFERCVFNVVTREAVPDPPSNFRITSTTPNSPELKELYHRSDIFFLPTLADYYGLNAAMEALASGLPIVMTGVGELDRYVDEGETGYVIPTGDAAAAKEKLLLLMRDPALRLRMGGAARRKAETAYDLRKTTDAVVQAALRAIGSR